ncbi:MAG: carboxypeptidase regulatory-like domain-containing protein [Gemmatimonadetes bacterium]|nr:carboxypeptidase regulatory-like domain-containing protein [Gemmatimonadota bacterium]
MTGYIVDARFGRPLEGVAVDIDGSRGEVITNARGVFVIHGLETGPRQLTASQLAYLTVTLGVEHQGTQLLIRLAPDPFVLDGLAATSIDSNAAGSRSPIPSRFWMQETWLRPPPPMCATS